MSKPSVSTTVNQHGSPVFEYAGQVDFRLVTDWQVMSFMHESMGLAFGLEVAKTNIPKYFEINSQAMKSNDHKLVITFIPKCMHQSDSDRARKTLLRCLTRLKLPIIWKEGRHGYEIVQNGRISRSWRLNTVFTA